MASLMLAHCLFPAWLPATGNPSVPDTTRKRHVRPFPGSTLRCEPWTECSVGSVE
jgi:hypothetical protein